MSRFYDYISEIPVVGDNPITRYEKEFKPEINLKWMLEHQHWCFIFPAIYVLLVLLGRWYMQDKPKYELRLSLILWNSLLAVFSIMGTIRVVPQLIYELQTHGFQYTLCNTSMLTGGNSAVWIYLFSISKVPELLDTAFIVLRKQNLIFLHWFHHAATVIVAWLGYCHLIPSGCKYGVAMNFLVHSVMYSYYVLRAMKISIPRVVSVIITTMQILQMLGGLFVTSSTRFLLTFNADQSNMACDQNMLVLDSLVFIYIVYFILFSHFFYNAYIKGNFRKTGKYDLNKNKMH